MGFDKNYPVKIPSNQIKPLKEYSTKITPLNNNNILIPFKFNKLERISLNPFFITGFADAESSFMVSITRRADYKNGFGARAIFSIGLHKKDLPLLQKIQDFFGGIGSISPGVKDSYLYQITSIEQITSVIIPHFEKYPLITQKLADYLLFKMAVQLIKNKNHLTKEGLERIVAIKASLNKGLTEELKAAFPKTLPYPRPLVVDQKIQNPY